MRSALPRPGAARASSATTTARLMAPVASARPVDLRSGRVAAPLAGTTAFRATSVARPGRLAAPGRRALHVAAVFERFTERAIKGVMLAQQEAKALGASEVRGEGREGRGRSRISFFSPASPARVVNEVVPRANGRKRGWRPRTAPFYARW